MRIPLIVYRSLRQHALSSLLTAAAIALAAGLLMSVWTVRTQSLESFSEATGGFDAVLGARGSKLQLVLNALFHIEASPGNLAWDDYLAIRRNPAVRTAIPIAVGDNLRGYRLVGTVPEMFEAHGRSGTAIGLEPGGRMFDESAKEAVVGSFAARKLGLRLGDQFHPFHGLVFDPTAQHADIFTVTGILKATGTPVDRVVWIPLKGLQTMSGHDPKAATDVSAVLVQVKGPAAGLMLDILYNRQGNRLTFAYPVEAILADLFNRLGWFDRVLSIVAGIVALVAAASVLAAIHNSMESRRRDIAILRALGARRRTVFGVILAESATIGLVGCLAGYAVHFAIMSAVAATLRAQVGVLVPIFAFHPVLIEAPAALILLCVLGGAVPAMKAYRLSVADGLSPLS